MQRLQIYKKFCKVDKIIVCEIIIISIFILPILILSTYSVPAADDFFKAYVMRLNIEEGKSYVRSAFERILNIYESSGGYIFANFLSHFFSPMVRGGIWALRVVVCIVNTFFWISLCLFVRFSMINSCKVYSERKILLACILVVLALTNNDINSEVMTWYCVVVEYVLLVAGMLWGILFFIKALQKEKNIYVVLASLIGFFISGGALNVTALNCVLYLAVGTAGFIVYNKRKISIICFCSALTGGLINVASPGNYIRHDAISGSYSIGEALKTAAFLGWSRIQYLMFETPFVLLLVVFFILMLRHNENSKREKRKYLINPVWLVCVVFLSVVVVNFPVCLGYGSGIFPDRCVWVEDCCIYLGTFSWTAYLAGWIQNRYRDGIVLRKDTLLCIIISSILFFCNLGNVRDLDGYPIIQIVKQLTNGQAAEFKEYWDGVFEEIESTDYGEVVIYRDEIKTNPFIYGPGIDSHIDNWINSAAAHFYGKDWICILKKE